MCFLNIRSEGGWHTFIGKAFHKEVATTEKAWHAVIDFLASLRVATHSINALEVGVAWEVDLKERCFDKQQGLKPLRAL